MLQRSTHEAPVDVPDIPATIQPGEVIDWPHPIAGFEPVKAQGPADRPDLDVPKSPKKKADSPAAAAGEELTP